MPGMDLPDIKTKTVPTDALQRIEITYKNKQKLVLDHVASEARLSDLVKKASTDEEKESCTGERSAELTHFMKRIDWNDRSRNQHEHCV